jgi:BASS family bile acid:Na+ symporter
MIGRVITLFPLWALLLSGCAFFFPQPFAALKPAIVYLLGLVMFGMGMTLMPASFAAVLKRPGIVALGIFLQFLIMPLTAWLLSMSLGLSSTLLAGMVLVGASPGGTASNVICYLARADVALSITLTAMTTLLAVAATPLLTLIYAGYVIEVPAKDMLLDIVKIVLLPVAAGVAINMVAGHVIRPLQTVFPLVSVVAIVVIIAIIVALNRPQLTNIAPVLLVAVTLHNVLGLAGGYWGARLFRLDKTICRTVAIEVGMQNSGLAVALAVKYFAPAAALPGALFSIWHNLSGAMLAGIWRKAAPKAQLA